MRPRQPNKYQVHLRDPQPGRDQPCVGTKSSPLSRAHGRRASKPSATSAVTRVSVPSSPSRLVALPGVLVAVDVAAAGVAVAVVTVVVVAVVAVSVGGGRRVVLRARRLLG